MLEKMKQRCKCGGTSFSHGYEGEANCLSCDGENGNDIDITATSIGYNEAIDKAISLIPDIVKVVEERAAMLIEDARDKSFADTNDALNDVLIHLQALKEPKE